MIVKQLASDQQQINYTQIVIIIYFYAHTVNIE